MKSKQFFLSILVLFSVLYIMSCDPDPDPVDECDIVNCQNGGTCIDGICDCPPGYSGTECETFDPCYGIACGDEGYCEDGECICPWGYTGQLCQTQVTPTSMKITRVDVISFPLTDQYGDYWDNYSATNPLQHNPDIYIETYKGLIKLDETAPQENCFPGVQYTFYPDAIITISSLFTTCTIQLYDNDSTNDDDFMCWYDFSPTAYDTGFPEKFRLYNQHSWHQLELDVYVEWSI